MIKGSQDIISAKAKSLYYGLKKQMGDSAKDEPLFSASNGWFNRFKRRASLHNLKLTGEAASADIHAASISPTELAKLIEQGGYCATQIFSVDGTALFWKKMPATTFLAEEEKTAQGLKPEKDRLALMLGGNVLGYFKLKPLLVYHSENPRAFKGKVKTLLPGTWRSNSKAWVTATFFQDWFSNLFVPAAKAYLLKSNLSFKCLLLLDNAQGHPQTLGDLFPEVKVVFLPPNSTSLLQPMDQTVIATFKCCYTRHIITQAIMQQTLELCQSLENSGRAITSGMP
jgi:hypothetical protein